MKVDANPKKMVLALFRRQGGDELLKHQAEMESDIIESANRLVEVTDVGDPIESPSVEDRTDQLEKGFVALVDGDFRTFYLKQYVGSRLSSDWESVSGYVGMEPKHWEKQKDTIRQTWEDADMTADDEVDAHIRGVHGVGKDEFESVVVNKAEDRSDADLLESFLAGDPYDSDYYVFVGLRTANQALEAGLSDLE